MSGLDPDRVPSPFAHVRRVRSFDDVTDQIREAIAGGRLRAGERLPPERDLCEQFGVGRPTLREALRSLESIGIVEVRHGKGGGVYVARPSAATLGAALARLVRFDGASLADLAELRESIEPDNARLAAERADDDDLAALEALVVQASVVARTSDRLLLLELDSRWHEAVARATGNPLRLGICLGVHEAMLANAELLASTDRHAGPIPRDLARITKAVAARDADAAEDAMRTHVQRWTHAARRRAAERTALAGGRSRGRSG